MSKLTEIQGWLKDGGLARSQEAKTFGSRITSADAAAVNLLRSATLGGLVANLSRWFEPSLIADPESVQVRLESLGRLAAQIEMTATADEYATLEVRIEEGVKSLTSLRKALTGAWKTHCGSTFGAHDKLGQVLAGIDGTRAHGRRMCATARQGLALAQERPNSEVCDRFDVTRAQVVEQSKNLATIGLTPSVQRFLLRVAGKEATLADLELDALEWLKKMKAAADFDVSI